MGGLTWAEELYRQTNCDVYNSKRARFCNLEITRSLSRYCVLFQARKLELLGCYTAYLTRMAVTNPCKVGEQAAVLCPTPPERHLAALTIMAMITVRASRAVSSTIDLLIYSEHRPNL